MLLWYICTNFSVKRMDELRSNKRSLQPDDAQRHVTCLQLARSLGVHKVMDSAAKYRLARECLKRLKKAVDDKVEDLLPFEQYALVAIQLLWDIFAEQGEIILRDIKDIWKESHRSILFLKRILKIQVMCCY